MQRAALYARVSSEKQAREDSTSIDQQLRECRRVAIERGYQVVLVEQDVLSGLEPNRPGYQRVLEAARSGLVEVVLAWKWDRWGRNAGESISAYGELTQAGVLVDSVMEPGGDEVSQGIHAIMAQRSSKDTSQRTKLNLRARAARGDWVTSHAPFGYRRVRVAGRSTLEPDPETAPELRALFADALTGRYSLQALVRRAYERGYFDREARRLDRVRLYRVLRNPAYRGAVAYGRSSQSRFQAPGQRKGARPPDDWVVCENAHPALVPPEDWQRVQEWLDLHRREQGTVRGTVYLLTSLLWCAFCGKKLYGRTNPAGRQWYGCNSRVQTQSCSLPAAHGNTIERVVKAAVMAAFRFDRAVVDQAAELLAAEVGREAREQERRREQLQRRLRDHEDERKTLARRLLAGIIPEEIYQELEKESVQAMAVVRREIAALPGPAADDRLQQRLQLLAGLDWDGLDAAAWRETLVLLVERVTVRTARDVTIEYWPGAEMVRRAVGRLLA